MTSACVYLDNAATTPLDPAVADAMAVCHDASRVLGNPSSPHAAGRRAQAAVAEARASCAALIGAQPEEIVFTSGATEADNLALIGGARFRAHRGRHVVTMATEHKAVLGAAEALEREGFDVTRLIPQPDGLLALDDLVESLRPDTQLVSVMAVNNETGVMQDIAAIGALCRERGILFHTDAAQAAGKLPLDLARLPIDLLSMTAHKMHGPQGVGALYVRNRKGCGVAPLIFGGGQERGLRPGTLPVALIVGFGAAARLSAQQLDSGLEHVRELNDRLWRGIGQLEGVRRNGGGDRCFPGILNVSVADVEGESLLLALHPLCVGSGSACNSQRGEPSFVLKALGLSDLQAQASIRFSFSRMTTPADVDTAVERFTHAVSFLRGLLPPAGMAAG